MHAITRTRFEELFGADSDSGDDVASDDLSLDGLDEELNGGENEYDYIGENDNFLLLHAKIEDCDLVFTEIASILSSFEAQIGLLSSEITNLREESTALGMKLRNRKLLEAKLAKFIEDIIASPRMVDTINDGEVNEEYLKNLEVLSKKLKFVEVDLMLNSSMALKDVKPELERLKQKAVEKASQFIIEMFNDLTNPNTNIQIMQENVLLKYKYIITFLKEHDTETYKNVCKNYVDTMNKVLRTHFSVYIKALERLQLQIATSSDFCNFDTRSNYFSLKTNEQLKSRSSIFSLGDRLDILKKIDQPTLIPDISEANSLKYPYEALFRSLYKLMMDTASSEYLFVEAFFEDGPLFYEVFSGSFSIINEHLDHVLPNCYDAICLMLMICITRNYQVKLCNRRIPCLESYFDKIFIRLWPHFKTVLDMHLQSLRNFDVKTIWENDIHPHYIIRCYAELIASLMQLNCEYGDNQLGINLERLQLALDGLLVRLAIKFRRLKLQNLFLLNNYDMIIGILKEAGVGSGGNELVYFGEKLELSNYTICCSAEDLISYKTQPMLSNVETVVKDFAVKWKAALEVMHKEVITSCSNLLCGMEILKAAMAQLLNYYNRLSECVKLIPSGSTLNKNLVSISSISFEIRKYSRTL
ncbi:vacuolar protein sorting-associated protein 52 A isoform X1 [Carex littledalei]|uniref:Vacuolar protein sorting-associated protein 52 A isoform X1 n=1 Tax=Carex littledalei TaxID=544730 RepID=A0A833QVJ7_9POAL|nr:vacuolar protein sorting-associated protein 52 A isoform X1 [Carex littledalei]